MNPVRDIRDTHHHKRFSHAMIVPSKHAILKRSRQRDLSLEALNYETPVSRLFPPFRLRLCEKTSTDPPDMPRFFRCASHEMTRKIRRKEFRNSKLVGKGLFPARVSHWCMGWKDPCNNEKLLPAGPEGVLQ